MADSTAGKLFGYVRAGFLFYLVGLVTTTQLAFLCESFVPLELPYAWKTLAVTALVPGLFVAAAFRLGRTRRAALGTVLPLVQEDRAEVESTFKRLDWFIVAAVMFGLWAGGYFLVATLTEGREMHSLMLETDQEIHFDPNWVWFYLAVYPIFLVPLVVPCDKRFAKMVMYSYITVMLLCYTLFLVVPVSYPRPALAEMDFSSWALGRVYGGDPAWNCFPSSHCAMSLMAALVLFEISPLFGAWGLVVALTIGVSTLFTKQHYILDVVAGFGLTLVVYYAYFKGRIIEILDKKQREFYRRVEGVIEERLEEVVRKVVREELARAVVPSSTASGPSPIPPIAARNKRETSPP